MLLAIEQGNTNTLFAIHDGAEWIAQWRTATDSRRTADEYAVWLSQLMDLKGMRFDALTGCIISSVVPQSIFNLRNLARRYLSVEPLVIGDNVELVAVGCAVIKAEHIDTVVASQRVLSQSAEDGIDSIAAEDLIDTCAAVWSAAARNALKTPAPPECD